MIEVGDEIAGRYQLLEQLGTGGFGKVFRASDRGANLRSVALKVWFHREHASEAAMLRSLRHTAIIEYIDDGTTPGGEPFLVMELADGRSLLQRIQEGLVDAPVVIEAMTAVADALNYLHTRPSRVVHRDVSPQNILFVGNQAKLADVGIAKTIVQSMTSHSNVQNRQYAAPEMLAVLLDPHAVSQVGPKSDVFSFGATFFHAITGVPPRSTLFVNAEAEHENNTKLDATTARSEVRDIIRLCLRRDPDRRPTAADITSLLCALYVTSASADALSSAASAYPIEAGRAGSGCMTDDPLVQELIDADPLAQEIARHADDPTAILRILSEGLASRAPMERVDDATILTQLGEMQESDWPILNLGTRFAVTLSAYYGRAVVALRSSELRNWLRVRVSIHKRFPDSASFFDHVRASATEALNVEDIAVMMADNLSAYYGKAAVNLSPNEVTDCVRLVFR